MGLHTDKPPEGKEVYVSWQEKQVHKGSNIVISRHLLWNQLWSCVHAIYG